MPPRLFDVPLELYPHRPIVPEAVKSAVNVAGRKQESTPLAQRDQLFHVHGEESIVRERDSSERFDCGDTEEPRQTASPGPDPRLPTMKLCASPEGLRVGNDWSPRVFLPAATETRRRSVRVDEDDRPVAQAAPSRRLIEHRQIELSEAGWVREDVSFHDSARLTMNPVHDPTILP